MRNFGSVLYLVGLVLVWSGRASVRTGSALVLVTDPGLAMSAVLQRHGREHIEPERRRVGERRRTGRWDWLPFRYPSGDPDGFALPGDPACQGFLVAGTMVA